VSQSCCEIPVLNRPEKPSRISRIPGELPGSLAAGVLLALGFGLSYAPGLIGVTGMALLWSALAIGMVYGGRAALEALAARRFDIDVLMVLAAGLAAAMGHPEDGALLLFLFTLAGALEDRAMQRTMRAVEALSRLMPPKATVWMPRDSQVARDSIPSDFEPDAISNPGSARSGEVPGAWVDVDPREVRAGQRLWIRTGELVPCDARILDGASTVDQATLTGESIPRPVQPGDELYAGTINVGNPIEALALRPAEESSLQKILNLVISAQQQREPLQRVIDRLSQPYAVGVLVLSITVLTLWRLLFGFTLADAAYTAIALLIVASPCALIIATPTATLAAISRAARMGILFKGGQAIERLARMGSVCLDKTGTLTLGRPRLQQVHPVAWSDGRELLAAAAALESGSTHPIAVAVVEAAANRGVQAPAIDDLQDFPGRGIAGIIAGREARLGTYEHCEELIPVCLRGRIREVLEKVRQRGQIGVAIAIAGVGSTQAENPDAGQAAVLILSDAVRPGARELVDRLHDLAIRPIRMLTGDNRITAGQIAGQLGIDQWEAELLPEDKVRIMQALRQERRTSALPAGPLATLATLTPTGARRVARGVGVIGDGVNDAPALAAADVSIAIGSIGSDAALESADIVLLNEDLTAIPWAVQLSRRTRAIVLFNIILALSVIVLMGVATLVLSHAGWLMPLWAAVLAHEGGTLLVVLNSLRLLGARAPARHLSDPEQPVDMIAPEGSPVGLAA
jgi:Zn2+/Cd2+-exporting ATPase